MTPYRLAMLYHRAGLSLLPVRRDGTKAPQLPEGHPYLYQRPTAAELRRWFDRPNPPGIAVVGGEVSGNLELIDFDEDTIYPRWRDLVEAEQPGLFTRLNVTRTPRTPAGGRHVRYRVGAGFPIPGSTKLAQRRCLNRRGKPSRVTLVETRGTGGYALAPGCPPECHETRGLYTHESGPGLTDLETLTPDERHVLIRCARSFNEVVEEPSGTAARHDGAVVPPAVGLRPGEDFDRRGDWRTILEPHGWRVVREFGAVAYWRRPGKEGPGWSATTGRCKGRDGADLLYNFSGNAWPFEQDQAYGKFRAFALLNHDGNYSAAAAALAKRGYGGRNPPRPAVRRGRRGHAVLAFILEVR
jgi:putative DNA primase/helicase